MTPNSPFKSHQLPTLTITRYVNIYLVTTHLISTPPPKPSRCMPPSFFSRLTNLYNSDIPYTSKRGIKGGVFDGAPPVSGVGVVCVTCSGQLARDYDSTERKIIYKKLPKKCKFAFGETGGCLSYSRINQTKKKLSSPLFLRTMLETNKQLFDSTHLFI